MKDAAFSFVVKLECFCIQYVQPSCRCDEKKETEVKNVLSFELLHICIWDNPDFLVESRCVDFWCLIKRASSWNSAALKIPRIFENLIDPDSELHIPVLVKENLGKLKPIVREFSCVVNEIDCLKNFLSNLNENLFRNCSCALEQIEKGTSRHVLKYHRSTSFGGVEMMTNNLCQKPSSIFLLQVFPLRNEFLQNIPPVSRCDWDFLNAIELKSGNMKHLLHWTRLRVSLYHCNTHHLFKFHFWWGENCPG